MKNIVILGGGFAGVAAAKALLKAHINNIHIALIDKNAFHLFTPSLYEVATSEEPRQNIAIPFTEIFDNKIAIITDTVTAIDVSTNTIKLQKNDAIRFDYLVIALGSEPSYMHIPGLQEHAIALKTIEDAVMIKDKIKSMCCKEGECNKKVSMIIGGGGFSGTELAAEMLMYKDTIAQQNHLDKECLDVTIIQGSDRLLKELDSHVGDIAEKRIAEPNVHFAFGGHISSVTKTHVLTDDKKSYPYDILLWTGGVAANHLASQSMLPINKRGQLIVNENLQVENLPHIFAAGDIAGFMTADGKPAPGVAQVAEEQGAIAGKNITHLIKQESLEPYHLRHFGYIVPLKGRFAAAELMGGFHMDGFFGWVLQQLVFFRYLLSILPLWKAMKRWNRFEIALKQGSSTSSL